MENDSCGVEIDKPLCCTAARCFPRQTSVTSAPARARKPPRYEPMPPAPMTATFIAYGSSENARNRRPREGGDPISLAPGGDQSRADRRICAWLLFF